MGLGCRFLHMLPVVFDALMEVIKENNFSVTYIRIPKEHISHYVAVGALSGLRPINIVKAIVLNILAWRNQHKYQAMLHSMEKKIFYGVIHSGNMCYETVEKIVKRYKKFERTEVNAEILFHPGSVLEQEDQAKLTNTADLYFLTNAGRKIEADAMIQLKEKKII